MKEKKRGLGSWIVRRFKAAPAQSMVEFALALPVLLLATFGVVEFGRLLQAWLALENGARFGVRYAVTGEYNKAYCAEAGAALGLTAADGDADCKVVPAVGATDEEKQTARDDTQKLQDWARLPSIRDAALAGASGIAYDAAEAVSGDYRKYLVDAESHGTTFSSDFRGNPALPGYFMVSICSNRIESALEGVSPATYPQFLINDPALDASLKVYYDGHAGENDFQYFPTVCMYYNKVENVPATDPKTYHSVPQYYMDDAGGPGDRVFVTLTYRHNLIMPLLSDWWKTLRLNTTRHGMVEQFRTSRVTGLSDASVNPDTKTFTPSITNTPTVTDTPTVTPTITNTPEPCVTDGNGIRGEYYNYKGTNYFTSPIFIRIDDQVDFDWGSSGPGSGVGVNNFSIRWVAQVMPMYSGTYTFYTRSDDGQRLWVDNQVIVNDWTGHSATERSGTIDLVRCQKYDLKMEYYEGSGNASSRLSWSSSSQGKQVIPKGNLFADMGTLSTATVTNTPTITRTRTITYTPSQTYTVTTTRTATRTLIPSLTYTITLSPIPSRTFTKTLTFTPTFTKTYTPTYTITNTKTITNTPTITDVVVPTNTPTRAGGIGG